MNYDFCIHALRPVFKEYLPFQVELATAWALGRKIEAYDLAIFFSVSSKHFQYNVYTYEFVLNYARHNRYKDALTVLSSVKSYVESIDGIRIDKVDDMHYLIDDRFNVIYDWIVIFDIESIMSETDIAKRWFGQYDIIALTQRLLPVRELRYISVANDFISYTNQYDIECLKYTDWLSIRSQIQAQ